MPRLIRHHAALLLTAAAPAFGSGPDAATAARLAVVATGQSNRGLVGFCDERAPARAAAVRDAFADWARRADVEAVERRTDPAWLQKVRASLASSQAQLIARLEAQGTPDQVCEALPATWRSPDMDMRANYPLAYGPAPAAASPAPAPTAPQVATATGTVFTVSQLLQHYGDGTVDQRRARLGQPVFIRGKAERRGERWFLVQDDGTMVAYMPVSVGFSLAAHEGRDVVVTGTLNELPSAVVMLRDGRLVADPSGLRPSPVSGDAWMIRKGVPIERVRTAPGKGVRSGDIEAVMFSGNGVYLLLDDGWMYDRNGMPPPSDFDAKASRTLEPQYWHRWRKAGDGYEVRRANAQGRLRDEWTRLSRVWRVEPWPDGTPIAGSFAKQNFYGSIATGGTYHKEVWFFGKDGKFSTAGHSQSGAGSLAAMNGFTAGQTTVRTDQGSQTSGFASGGGGTVTNARRDGDGSGNRGTYKVDGYALELRFDSGHTGRLFAFPWGSDTGNAWIGGASYLENK